MIGKQILHYKILEELGRGGMGVVYKAHDTKLDRMVAIKFLPRHISADSEERERFKIEAKAAAALNHPNIATIHNIEEANDELFIVMEYIEGHELREILNTPLSPPSRGELKGGVLSIDDVFDYATQIASGLQAAHEKGVVHRDIKSSNIMITDKGQVKIMDFGLAKVRGGVQMTKVGTTLGTAAYMSPEQAQGEEVDHRTDIWALGVLLYEMLAGELPFKGEYEQAVIYSIINEQPEPLKTKRSDIPSAMADIVSRALAKDKSARYASTADMLQDLLAHTNERGGHSNLLQSLLQPRVLIPGALLLLLAGFLFFRYVQGVRGEQWARQEALPQIEKLMEDMAWTGEGLNSWRAYELATEAEKVIPDDPQLQALMRKISNHMDVHSEPPGARVSIKPYTNPEREWQYIGTTPLDSVRLVYGFGRMKLEKDGFVTAYDVFWNSSYHKNYTFVLHKQDDVPEIMVYIPAAEVSLDMPGIDHYAPESVSEFLIDRYEVTNRAYKRFVDSGGYQKQEYWKHPFYKNGREISWQEAMPHFTDETGQPGPATWSVGDYPEGQGDYPVMGVSWYEAAAYAEFAGKQLPTIWHWNMIAFTWASPAIVPQANLNKQGPISAYDEKAMHRFGVCNLAGNVREWCWNQSGSTGQRFILGGGWNDQPYAFNDAYAQPPFDRSATNGFRCIRYLKPDENRSHLTRTIERPQRDFYSEKPVSDETFDIFLNQYRYDQTPLNATVEWQLEEEDWIKQKITFDAAYASERVIAYLFLPKNTSPPYQTVVYFPGSNAIHAGSSEESLRLNSLTFLPKSGRALMYPIYKGTYERGDALDSDYPEETIFYKDHVIMWAKDLSRSIDYLETHEDIDKEKLAYLGISWGGAMGAIMPAVETRFKACVLFVAGLLEQRALPEADQINFITRVKLPVLMINGRYDFFFSVETSQKPMYDLLGTPEEHKKWVVYEGGHAVPRVKFIEETLAWLNEYLGPVSK